VVPSWFWWAGFTYDGVARCGAAAAARAGTPPCCTTTCRRDLRVVPTPAPGVLPAGMPGDRASGRRTEVRYAHHRSHRTCSSSSTGASPHACGRMCCHWSGVGRGGRASAGSCVHLDPVLEPEQVCWRSARAVDGATVAVDVRLAADHCARPGDWLSDASASTRSEHPHPPPPPNRKTKAKSPPENGRKNPPPRRGPRSPTPTTNPAPQVHPTPPQSPRPHTPPKLPPAPGPRGAADDGRPVAAARGGAGRVSADLLVSPPRAALPALRGRRERA